MPNQAQTTKDLFIKEYNPEVIKLVKTPPSFRDVLPFFTQTLMLIFLHITF
jgi:alkane 1-monooxygenase